MQETLRTILDKYTEHCKDALVLDSIMTSFPPEYVADHAILFTELIRNADSAAYPLVRLSLLICILRARARGIMLTRFDLACVCFMSPSVVSIRSTTRSA